MRRSPKRRSAPSIVVTVGGMCSMPDHHKMAFAGIWTNWTSVRKAKEGEVSDVFGFLTTVPNSEVAKVHTQAMPVILTAGDEFDTWLSASWALASKLQRPLPDGALRIVAAGEKEDPA